MVVRPHEGTRTKAKSDRLNLLWASQINTSQVMALFEDERHEISSVLEKQERNKPVISINTGEEMHNVWAITEPVDINIISGSLAEKPL